VLTETKTEITADQLKKELIGMNLHSVMTVDYPTVNYTILRVPSGWLYTNNTAGTTTLVPLFH